VTSLEVVASGVLTLLQDRGRTGVGHLGVGCSGAADPASYALANRLVGNRVGAACLEATLGGLAFRLDATSLVAVTGAPLEVTVGRRTHAVASSFYVRSGEQLRLGWPTSGLRTYVAVRGGILGQSVLGSVAWDTLAQLGTPPLLAGDALQVGDAVQAVPSVAMAPLANPAQHIVELPLVLGPRHDWFTDEALRSLTRSCFTVTSDTDRVGARLDGPTLARCRHDELASEGVVTGAVQVPTVGRPTLMLADHPVTGGYPVIGVVPARSLGRASQVAPGQLVRFHTVG